MEKGKDTHKNKLSKYLLCTAIKTFFILNLCYYLLAGWLALI